MLQPKRTKHRKAHKGRIKGDAKRGATLAFGTFGLKSLSQNGSQIVKLKLLVRQ
jgi:ribosomal protein L16/L10AE